VEQQRLSKLPGKERKGGAHDCAEAALPGDEYLHHDLGPDGGVTPRPGPRDQARPPKEASHEAVSLAVREGWPSDVFVHEHHDSRPPDQLFTKVVFLFNFSIVRHYAISAHTCV